MKKIALGFLFGIGSFITAMEIDERGSEKYGDFALMQLAIVAAEREGIEEKEMFIDRVDDEAPDKLDDAEKNDKNKGICCIVSKCKKWFFDEIKANEHINQHLDQSGDYKDTDNEPIANDSVSLKKRKSNQIEKIKRGRKPEVNWKAICEYNDNCATIYPCLGCTIHYTNRSSWRSHMYKYHRQIKIPKLNEVIK